MATRSSLSYTERAQKYHNPILKRLFEIAQAKKSNVTISADIRNTNDLLALADNFSEATIEGQKQLSAKHNFLIFEDRKFVGIGYTVQQQYHEGALRILEWAHINDRALLILAEMTIKGSLATGDYTKSSIEIARKHKEFVIGFVATRSLISVETDSKISEEEDFVIFTTGVNRSSKGDKLGQQYQTPISAIERGADFIIAGCDIYAAEGPVVSVKLYKKKGGRPISTG